MSLCARQQAPRAMTMDPVIGHPSLRAHLEVDLNFSVAFPITQVPVILGIHVTKRRESPNETFTPGGQGRKHEGWASSLEAALCHPHAGTAIDMVIAIFLLTTSLWRTQGGARESMQTSGLSGHILLHIKNDVSF